MNPFLRIVAACLSHITENPVDAGPCPECLSIKKYILSNGGLFSTITVWLPVAFDMRPSTGRRPLLCKFAFV